MSTERTTDADRSQSATDKDEPQDYQGILGYTPDPSAVTGPSADWSPFRPKPYPVIDSYEVTRALTSPTTKAT